MKDIDIKLARYETARVYLIKAVRYLSRGIHYTTVEKSTNNYDNFRKIKPMQISMEGCTKTIYRSGKLNRDARAWHDSLHLAHDLDFSLDEELEVAKLQQDEVERYLNKLNIDIEIIEDAGTLIFFDVVRQREYYSATGRFLHNQEAFILEYFLDYIEATNGDLI